MWVCVCVILRILVQICISQDSGSKILKSGLKDAFFSAWWQFLLCLLVCVFEERHPRSYYKSMIRHIPENNFVLHAWRSPHGLHICFWHFRSHLTFGCFFLILQRTNVPAVFLHEFCYHLRESITVWDSSTTTGLRISSSFGSSMTTTTKRLDVL